MIEFRLDPRSGVPTYLQLVHQVKQGLRLGMLHTGDQLPTVKEVVATLAINPNTVLKAYRELDREGLVEGRRGQGTFVAAQSEIAPPDRSVLTAGLVRWIRQAQNAGCDEDDVVALFAAATHKIFGRFAA
jgi:DNA-binding transcriptional regulator YhcF (GntR family)